MTIEQRPELNRYVDPSIPLTWEYRRRQLKWLLPLMIFFLVLLLDQVTFHAWVTGQLTWEVFGTAIGGGALASLWVFGILELGIRRQQRSKRALQIKNKRIITVPGKQKFRSWSRIQKFQFAPVESEPGLTIVSMYSWKNRQIMPPWKIAVENHAQVQELIRCLEEKKLEQHLGYEIAVLQEPAKPEAPRPISYFGFTISMVGFILMYHGVPMFLMWLLRNDVRPGPVSYAEAHSQCARLIANHFSSAQEFYHFILILSICLNVVGISLFVCGQQLAKRKRETLWVIQN